jgi:hypothetical protein
MKAVSSAYGNENIAQPGVSAVYHISAQWRINGLASAIMAQSAMSAMWRSWRWQLMKWRISSAQLISWLMASMWRNGASGGRYGICWRKRSGSVKPLRRRRNGGVCRRRRISGSGRLMAGWRKLMWRLS